MEEICFMVQGSSPEPYRVTFVKSGSNIGAFCSCPAGTNGQSCKHRLCILNGDGTALVSSNIDEVEVVRSWLPNSDLDKALKELQKAEKEYDDAKKRLANAKKNLARCMRK